MLCNVYTETRRQYAPIRKMLCPVQPTTSSILFDANGFSSDMFDEVNCYLYFLSFNVK